MLSSHLFPYSFTCPLHLVEFFHPSKLIGEVSAPPGSCPWLHGLPTFTLALLQPSPHRASRRIKDINPIMSLPLLQIFKCFLKIVSKLIRRASHSLAPNTVSPSIHRLFLSPHPSHFSHTGLPSIPWTYQVFLLQITHTWFFPFPQISA